MHNLSFLTRLSSSFGIDLKSTRSTRWPYLLRSTVGGGLGVLGFEAVRSVRAALATAAVVDAHVAGPGATAPLPLFEEEGVRMGRDWD